jgi:hypothetical protein
MCLRTMAREWEFVGQYERNNLAHLPTELRMLLLSNIAVHGPEEGVGIGGLKDMLMPPDEDEATGHDAGDNNEGFYRLDLSGAVGRSLSFKQLLELVQKPATPPDEDTADLTWEESITRTLSPPIPHLTYLSLSHPPPTISWPRLLTFAKHIPTLTHLSLSYWPVPSLTPNAKTAVVSSRFGKDIQYGGTNYYSHSLDNDFREAATVLRRMASRLYGLEYLDVTGCSWLQALRWKPGEGVDWGGQWVKIKTLRACSGFVLGEQSEFWEVVRFTESFRETILLQMALTRKDRRNPAGGLRWIEVEKDDFQAYDGLWKGDGEEEKRKRKEYDTLKECIWTPNRTLSQALHSQGASDTVGDAERRSVWEQ